MSLLAFIKKLASTDFDFERRVQREQRRYRGKSTEELAELLRTCDYLNLPGTEPGLPGMADCPSAQRLLDATRSGAYQPLIEDWNTILNDLVAAERACGYRGRPLLIDYDLHLTCIVRVLAEREKG